MSHLSCCCQPKVSGSAHQQRFWRRNAAGQLDHAAPEIVIPRRRLPQFRQNIRSRNSELKILSKMGDLFPNEVIGSGKGRFLFRWNVSGPLRDREVVSPGGIFLFCGQFSCLRTIFILDQCHRTRQGKVRRIYSQGQDTVSVFVGVIKRRENIE